MITTNKEDEMYFNSKDLRSMIDQAEDQELEVEVEWNADFPELIECIWIEGMLIENTQIDDELELAREDAEVYASDEREANNYYRG